MLVKSNGPFSGSFQAAARLTTGLRQGELQSITIGKARLDESPAWFDLSHQDEKSGKGASIPLRDDVADLLRKHLAERLNSINGESRVFDGMRLSSIFP